MAMTRNAILHFPLVLFACVGHVCCLGNNFFKKGTSCIPAVDNTNVVFGVLMYKNSGLRPTCGWSAHVVSSPGNNILYVTGLMLDGILMRKLNNSAWRLSHTEQSKDLSNKVDNSLGSREVEVRGTFSCSDPNGVKVIFECVCISGITDCGLPPTTTTTTTTTTTPAPWYLGQHTSDPTEMLIQKVPAACYGGLHITTLTSPRHWMSCASKCVPERNCVGVNVWANGTRCDLVLDEDVDGSLGVIENCQFYLVLWKA